ncbi:MAG TPA: sialidase family protein [Methylocella sp.]|nr:sialidase family protein [Methylocella sp.]
MKAVVLAGTLIFAAMSSVAEPNFAPRLSDPVSLVTNGANPTVAFDAKTGARFVAWIRPSKSSFEVVVSRSRDDELGYGSPVVVSASDEGIVLSSVSPPQVAVDPRGEVYVLYERLVPTPYLKSGRGILRLSRSTDGGRSFAMPVDVVTAEGVETSAEMANMAIASDGTVVVAWLDYREAISRAALPEEQRPKVEPWLNSGQPKVEVRIARSTNGGVSFTPSVLIADTASERSRVSLTIAPDGTYYSAWRAKLSQFKGSYDSVRDIVISASRDGGVSWTSPVKVHDDRFKAGSCPEITHGIAVDSKGRVHVAWYTGTSVRPGIYYAVSSDQGKTFSAPLPLLAEGWVPYADVKLAVDGSDHVWITFEDRRDDRADQVVLAGIDPQGNPAHLGAWPGRAPDITSQAGKVTLVWTAAKGEIRTLQAASM